MEKELAVRCRVRINRYCDSMVLMYISAQLEKLEGINQAMAIMGTDANKDLLKKLGLYSPEATKATANDLIVVFRADNKQACDSAFIHIDEILEQRIRTSLKREVSYHSIESGVEALPGANIALISIPGPFAAREAMRAIDRGLNVFLFSDNVSIEDEVELKRQADQNGLLMMGPDCGTAIVNGTCLGFSNVVRRGPIGIIGASGTGIQEICALLDREHLGISHALGTGSRDLSTAVSAITTLRAIGLLEADPMTELLVIVSKLPDLKVAEKVLARADACAKQAVVCFLSPKLPVQGQACLVGTLEEAAQAVATLAKGGIDSIYINEEDRIEKEKLLINREQRFVRGLYCGGSLCLEAMLVWQRTLGGVWSNTPLRSDLHLTDPFTSKEHSAIDLGGDVFTVGRPHPMIDPTIRQKRILAEANDPSAAVIVLDVVLGYGAHPDMAGELATTITEARAQARKAGRYLPFIVYVCGTNGDPQERRVQEKKLDAAGAILAPSNASAARMASRFVENSMRK